MRPFRRRCPSAAARRPPTGQRRPGPDWAALPGPVTDQHDPQALFATESLAQALRQLEVYGRDGLPVLSADGHQSRAGSPATGVLRAIARQITTAQADRPGPARRRMGAARPGVRAAQAADPAARLPDPGSHHRSRLPAAGRALRTLTWPPGANVVSVLHNRRIRDPDPAHTLHPGDRIVLLIRRPRDQPPGQPPGSGAAGRTADSPAPTHGQSNADGQ